MLWYALVLLIHDAACLRAKKRGERLLAATTKHLLSLVPALFKLTTAMFVFAFNFEGPPRAETVKPNTAEFILGTLPL